MNAKIIEILKGKDYIIPSFLIKNYASLGLSGDNAILLMYFLNCKDPIICDYSRFSKDLNLDIKTIMSRVNELVELKLIEINIKKNSSSKLEEYIDLSLFYNKMFLQLIDVKEEKKESNIYSIFEKELGRNLSPIEYELINEWKESNYKEEIIIAALKEAIFNGVNNFRYIDRILFEWNKKGIDTLEKIEKNKKNFRKSTKIEVPEYDWLSNDE